MIQLQNIRSNIVQAIRAYSIDDLARAAQDTGQHFLYAELTQAQTKADVLEIIARAFLFPEHFGKNLDALYDCLTNAVHSAGPQVGFIVVLDQIPGSARFDRDAREQLLDTFADVADFWADRKVPFRCFYSFSIVQDNSTWDPEPETPQVDVKPKPVSKNGFNSTFGTRMPMMCSVFDTRVWQQAAPGKTQTANGQVGTPVPAT